MKQVKEEKEKRGRVGAGKMFCWQSREISLGCNMLVFGFLSIYCTDTLNMPIALVGTILMLSKVFDGVTDIFAGYIVDKTNTRFGRGRPYEWCIVGMWLCTIIMFNCPPAFSTTVKCIWVFITYTLVNSVFATFLNASKTVYLVRAFKNTEQHVAIQSYGSIVTMLFVIGFNISFPILMGKLATSPAGWSTLILIYALPLMVLGMLRFFTIQENADLSVKEQDKLRLRDIFSVLRSNPYIYIVAITTLVYNLITNMGVGVYYFTHIMKDVSVMGLLALAPVVVLPLVFTFPAIIHKYSTRKLIMIGLLVNCLGLFVNFLAYDNLLLLAIGSVLVGAGAVPISMLTPLMIIDCAEYNQFIGKHRLEGTMSSINGFATKLGSAFGVGIMGVLLGLAGYDTASTSAVMPDSALTMIRLLYSIIPMALYFIVIVLLNFYKLDGKIEDIRKQNRTDHVETV